MKMICNVPDEVIKSVRMGTWCGSSVVEKMIANGTPIPDNATKGDVIKVIFPNSDIEEHRTYMKIVEGDYLLPCAYQWWNSPYQKGGTNEK